MSARMCRTCSACWFRFAADRQRFEQYFDQGRRFGAGCRQYSQTSFRMPEECDRSHCGDTSASAPAIASPLSRAPRDIRPAAPHPIYFVPAGSSRATSYLTPSASRSTVRAPAPRSVESFRRIVRVIEPIILRASVSSEPGAC